MEQRSTKYTPILLGTIPEMENLANMFLRSEDGPPPPSDDVEQVLEYRNKLIEFVQTTNGGSAILEKYTEGTIKSKTWEFDTTNAFYMSLLTYIYRLAGPSI